MTATLHRSEFKWYSRDTSNWDIFDLANPTEEHAMLREMIRDLSSPVEPQAHEHDKHERFNLELFRMLGEYGLLGITVPEEYGGAGLDATAAVLAHEEISASDPGFGLAYLAHSMLFVNNLAQNGSEEQKARILTKVCLNGSVRWQCLNLIMGLMH